MLKFINFVYITIAIDALSESNINKSQSQMEVQQTSSASRYKTHSTKRTTCKGKLLFMLKYIKCFP